MTAIAAPPFRRLLTNTTDPGMKANVNERRKESRRTLQA